MMAATSSPEAMSPVPFFRDVERVGVLCAVSAAASVAAPAASRVCRIAVEELTALLSARPGSARLEVVALERNDARLGDAATLGVLLHVHAQRLEPSGDRTLAASIALHRSRSGVGGPPLFPAPPEAATAPDPAVDDWLLRPALRRLLIVAVARPLGASR